MGFGDVWRLGPGAICSFGLGFSTSQVNFLIRRFKRVFVLFDGGEIKATNAANRLCALLSVRGVDVTLMELDEGDPGEMSRPEADYLMRDLGFRK